MKTVVCLLLCALVLYFGVRHIINLWKDRKSIVTKVSQKPLFEDGTVIDINGNKYVYRQCKGRDLKQNEVTIQK